MMTSSGYAYRLQKMYYNAEMDYSKSIELDPKYVTAYNNRASLYTHLKRFDKAIQDYEIALQLAPNYAIGYNNRGYAYYQMKQFDKALEDLNKVRTFAAKG